MGPQESTAPKLTAKEQTRQNKRMIDRAGRKIDRERKKLEASEKKYMNEIKALAKKGKHTPAKILSKDIVRLRGQIDQYFTMTSQLKALSMKIATMQTTSEIAGALKGATSTMSEVNKTMDIKDIQNVLKEFSKESQKLELGQEAMGDAFEMAGDVDEADVDQMYDQILEEVGLEVVEGGAAATVSRKKIGEEMKAPENDVTDLEARLNQLKQ